MSDSGEIENWIAVFFAIVASLLGLLGFYLLWIAFKGGGAFFAIVALIPLAGTFMLFGAVIGILRDNWRWERKATLRYLKKEGAPDYSLLKKPREDAAEDI